MKAGGFPYTTLIFTVWTMRTKLYETGFGEYAAGDGICVCEWADLIPEALPAPRLDISIVRTGDAGRHITVREVEK